MIIPSCPSRAFTLVLNPERGPASALFISVAFLPSALCSGQPTIPMTARVLPSPEGRGRQAGRPGAFWDQWPGKPFWHLEKRLHHQSWCPGAEGPLDGGTPGRQGISGGKKKGPKRKMPVPGTDPHEK